jgi:Na+-driven multidrug efflux pump
MLSMLVGYWGVAAPLGLYLCEAHALGVAGLWTGLAAGTGVTAALTLLRMPASRERRATAPKSPSAG